MYKRLWPEITKACAKSDFTIDVSFEDGKTVNFDLRSLLGKVEGAKELLTYRYFDSFQTLPHALLWSIEEDYWLEIEINGGDIYNGSFQQAKKKE